VDIEKTLKWIGAVVALGGLALGVVNYLATVRRDVETRNLEARKQYLTRQLDLYTEATRSAAKIATAKPGSPDHAKALARFWELYWGELAGPRPRLSPVAGRFVGRPGLAVLRRRR
jgi:hypothetical protein